MEEDKFISDMYNDKLKEQGFEVELTTSGEEALEKISEIKPDLILLDLLLPKMYGLEFLKIIKKDPALSQIKVIILTNINLKEDAQEGLRLGADDFVIKAHFTPTEIMNKIKKVLNK